MTKSKEQIIKDQESIINLFGKHFKIERFTGYDLDWVQIIGEPYRKEVFAKDLFKFIKEAERQGLWK